MTQWINPQGSQAGRSEVTSVVDSVDVDTLAVVRESVERRLAFVMLNGDGSDFDDGKCEAWEAVLDDLDRLAAVIPEAVPS